ncbi:sialate O-acetylesterase [candidate division KSB1 bacterium]|nr:sialate O-acetylesterase [candidate division KSB1 bacterium]
MKLRLKSKSLILFLLFQLATPAISQIKLPKLISDGMVLQRSANVRIWGWAAPGEQITIHFVDAAYQTTATTNGKWELMLSDLKAGGPYDMQIDASNSITIHDIVVGDVWVCSGQSNMGLPLGWLRHVYQGDIAHSENQFIRQFLVPIGFSFDGREDDYKTGAWQQANPENVGRFTAVGYFFARELYDTYKVPIGLINASLGGSSTEAWISEESIKSFPQYYEDALRFKYPGLLDRIKNLDNERVSIWNKQLKQKDAGYKNHQKNWYDPFLDTSDWETMHVPGYWQEAKTGAINGVVWFRRNIDIPLHMAGKPAIIKLGRIVDIDSVFINGQFIGTTGSQYAPRRYNIPENLLKVGENTIVVRIINTRRRGGFVPGKQYELSAGENTLNLESDWKYRIGATAEPFEEPLFTGKIPTGLFNSMLAPILNYNIKGVVWYQGESNTSRAFEHYDLFKLLINDWRTNWHQGDFPFLFVQLPNFVEVNTETTQYDWAIFRESQLKALAIPNTGMAVTIDVGEWNDIHPVNKKPVGERLALAAQHVAYGEKNIVYSGPIYKSMKTDSNKIILSFTQVGSGLVAQNSSQLTWFEICGIDNNYVPANAKLEKDRIIVWSDNVSAPVAVRYAWANNPEGANLYNKEGLPASPFRTSELY